MPAVILPAILHSRSEGQYMFSSGSTEKETKDEALRQQGSVSKSNEGDFVMDRIFGTLALETTQSQEWLTLDAEIASTQASPWLERTRRLHYLKGVPLDRAARLARLPLQHNEAVLYEIGSAVDRLVEAAYTSLCEEKVNFFGQKRIASFLPRMDVYSRPIVYKLKESTHKQYKQFWKRALAFICRASDPEQDIQFQHSFGSCQTALLDSLLGKAAEKVAKPWLAGGSKKCQTRLVRGGQQVSKQAIRERLGLSGTDDRLGLPAVEVGAVEEPSASWVTSLGKRLAMVPNVRWPHALAPGSGYERAKSRVREQEAGLGRA